MFHAQIGARGGLRDGALGNLMTTKFASRRCNRGACIVTFGVTLMNRAHCTLALTAVTLLLGCSSAQGDWTKAAAANTVTAYQDYLNKHPSGDNSVEATNRIHALQDDQDWSQAKQANSIDAYRNYLQQQPAGAHVKEAQDSITATQRAADWKSTEGAGTVAALQDFLKKYTEGSEVEQARSKLAALTGFEVRIASAKTEADADRTQKRLRAKYASVLHDVNVVTNSSGRGYWLVSTPMSETQAYSACAQLKKERQTCKVVKSDSAAG